MDSLAPSTPARQSRREFLNIAVRMAALWGLSPSLVPKLAASVKALSTGRVPVLWLEGSNCSGCSVSLLNSYPVLPVSLLTKHLSLQFHQTISTTQGQQAVAVPAVVGAAIVLEDGDADGGAHAKARSIRPANCSRRTGPATPCTRGI